MTDNPFPAGNRDPLLLIARIISIFLMVMMGIAMGALAIGIPVVLVKQHAIVVELASEGLRADPAMVIAGIVGIMVNAIAALALTFAFLKTLNRVIDSVGAGEPFAAENSVRLTRMGWLALAIQAAAIPAGVIGAWLAHSSDRIDADVDIGFSGSGLVLALLLFILARVFRHGAALRSEVEGTV